MVGGGHPSYLSVSFNRLVGCIPCYVQYAIGIFDNCGSGMDFSVRWHNFGVVGPVDSSVSDSVNIGVLQLDELQFPPGKLVGSVPSQTTYTRLELSPSTRVSGCSCQCLGSGAC